MSNIKFQIQRGINKKAHLESFGEIENCRVFGFKRTIVQEIFQKYNKTGIIAACKKKG